MRRKTRIIDRGPGTVGLWRKHTRAAGMVEVGVLDDPELAQIAAHNEFGTETIPERSFLRATLDANRERYEKLIQVAVDAVLRGTPPEQAYQWVAAAVRRDVRQAIVELREPPNAPSTIAAKGSDNPLVDTGELHDAIDFRIVAGGPGGGS